MAENPQSTLPGTDAQRQQAANWALLANSSGGPKAITAPPDQKLIVFFDQNGQMQYADNPAYDQNAPSSTIYGTENTGYFTVGNDGQARVVMNPNPDLLVSKAIGRQNEQALIDERRANAQAGRGHMTNSERITIEQNAQRLGIDQGTLQQRINEFSQTQDLKDRQFLVDKAKIEQDIATGKAQAGLVTAQTARTGAETSQIGAQTAALTAKTPSEIEQNQALAAYQRAQAADLARKAGQPTVASTEGPTVTYVDPRTGEIKEQTRQGFVPKTAADIATRQAQMAQAMQAKSDELYRKIGPNYTADQADADLKNWAQQTLAPQQQILNAAGNELAFSRGKDIAEAQRQAMQTAQGMGTLAVSAYNAQAPRMLGEGAAEGITKSLNAANKAMGRPDQDYSWMVTKQPNLMGQVQGAVQGAMQQIGPQQLQQLNNPQAIQSAWDMTAYMPSNRSGPPPPAPAGPPAAAPGGNISAGPIPGLAPGGLRQGGTPPLTVPPAPQLNVPQAQPIPVPTGGPPAPPQVNVVGSNPWANNPSAPQPAPPPPPAPGGGFDPSSMWGANRGQPLGPSNYLTGTVPPPMTGFPQYPVSPWTPPPPPFPGMNINGLNVNGMNVQGLNLNSPNPQDAQGANQPWNAGLSGLNVNGLNMGGFNMPQPGPSAGWNQQPYFGSWAPPRNQMIVG